jgi:hypothetical protein
MKVRPAWMQIVSLIEQLPQPIAEEIVPHVLTCLWFDERKGIVRGSDAEQEQKKRRTHSPESQ